MRLLPQATSNFWSMSVPLDTSQRPPGVHTHYGWKRFQDGSCLKENTQGRTVHLEILKAPKWPSLATAVSGSMFLDDGSASSPRDPHWLGVASKLYSAEKQRLLKNKPDMRQGTFKSSSFSGHSGLKSDFTGSVWRIKAPPFIFSAQNCILEACPSKARYTHQGQSLIMEKPE